MNKYIIKYFKILLTVFIIVLCLFIMYGIITISLIMTILEYYIDKIL